MPKTPIDYSKGLIYSIVCKTDETLIYIGSTTNFRIRKNKHKYVCNNEKNKDHNLQVYVMIRSNGGWDNFNMKPIKEFPCENNIQLTIEEERIRVEMQAKLNTNRAYLSPAERKEDEKKYYEANKAKISEYGKKYYEANTAKIAETGKKYREANPAKIAEKCKKYYEANTANIAEYMKKYAKDNAAKIAEQNKTEK